MKWFRNTESYIEKAPSSTEEITDAHNDYTVQQIVASANSETIGNCTKSNGHLYRDTFSLIINNFTSDKNGYYWCQIFVNNSISQPSQYAWFYAADSSSCTQQSYFEIASKSEIECAVFQNNTFTAFHTDSITTTTHLTLTNTDISIRLATTLEVSTNVPETGIQYLYYVVGFLGFFFLLLASLTIALLFFYAIKVYRKRNKRRGKQLCMI